MKRSAIAMASSVGSQNPVALKKRKCLPFEKDDSDVEILHVEPGSNKRQVQIIKVEHPKNTKPDVEILKVVPGTSGTSTQKPGPVNSKQIRADGFIRKKDLSEYFKYLSEEYAMPTED